MKELITRWSFAGLVSIGAFLAAQASAEGATRSSLGAAKDYSIVVFGDFSSPYYSSATGRLAAEGDIILNNYGLATGLSSTDSAGISVIAGGSMTFEYGKIYAGHTLVSGSTEFVGSAVRNGLTADQLLLEHVDLPIDFNQLESELIDHSMTLSRISANGSVISEYGGLYLTGDCSSDLQVFNLDGSLLLQAHTFQVSCVPSDAHIIFNVSGASTGMSYMTLEPLRPMRSRILFNFYEATNLTLTSIGVEGSILAPKAVIDNPTGEVHGTVVAKSWDGPMHLDYVQYNGYNESMTLCEGPVEL